ncbi:hypothetical protein HFD88_000640 [Aspergillus terreus]|nr:hypothetical protein HFD88_000640 [Aspergillus terreus]
MNTQDVSGSQEAPGTTDESEYISGMKRYSLMASLVLCFFLIMLDIAIVSTAVPKITSQFHSLGDVGWYGSAYQLSCWEGVFQFQTKARQYTFLAYFGIFELGSLLCAVAVSSKMLIVGRAVAGIGSSGLLNGGLTIASAAVPLQQRPKYFGIMMGISQMGIVCGPLLGGAFTSYVTWRWCFYINLPIGAVVAVLLWIVEIPSTVKPRTLSVLEIFRTKLDLFGFVLFAPAAIQFFLALDEGGRQYAWNSSVIIGLFCGAGAMIILFVIWEWRQGDNAMIPFSVIKLLPVWSSCVAMMLFFGCLQMTAYYLPIYFQTVKLATPMLSGVYTLPNILGQLIFAVIGGIGIGRLGYYLPFILASSILMSIANGLLSTLSPSTSTAKWVGYQILLGVGRGLGTQTSIIAVQNTIAPAMIPVAMAMISFSQTFGGSIYLAIAQTILTNSLSSALKKHPDIDVAAVIAAGASPSGVVQAADGDPAKLAKILAAYAKSVDNTFYLAAGSTALIFFVAWGMGMKDIRKKDKTIEPNADEEKGTV